MSDQNEAIQPQAQNQPAAQPQPGSPEYQAKLASLAPANVPDKFKNPDGSVNIASLTEAYRALEVKQSQGATPPAAAPKNEQPADLDAAFRTPTPNEAETVWQTAQAELANEGKLSDATRTALKQKHSVTDAMIDGMVAGAMATRQAIGRQLADAVGGVETMNETIAWAKSTMNNDQLAHLRSALEGPNGPLVMIGLKAQMDKARPTAQAKTEAPTPKSILDLTPTPSNTQVTPFTSQAEYLAAFKDPRYRTDPAYARLVGMRAAITR